jgi:hypothetical protein
MKLTNKGWRVAHWATVLALIAIGTYVESYLEENEWFFSVRY